MAFNASHVAEVADSSDRTFQSQIANLGSLHGAEHAIRRRAARMCYDDLSLSRLVSGRTPHHHPGLQVDMCLLVLLHRVDCQVGQIAKQTTK